jgi:spore maturation protein CgeB
MVRKDYVMSKILVFQHTKSRYNVLASMTESICKAFQRQGIDATLFDDWSKSPQELVEYVENKKFDSVFSINMFLGSFFPKSVHHIYFSVDSYANTPQDVVSQGKVLFADKSSSDLFSERNSVPASWFPHAIAKESIDEAKKTPFIPLHVRPYDVVLLGSFIDHEEELEAWEKILRPVDVEAFIALSEKALEDPTFLFQKETFRYIEENLLPLLQEKGIVVADLVASVERYIRGVDKKNVLEALYGLDVHVFSDKKYKCDAIFHDPVPFSRVGEVCSQAKIVINSSPSIRQGFHERLFLGLASGAIVLSSQIDLLPKWLEEKGALVSYKRSTLSTVRERLALAQLGRVPREEISSWLEREHTWDVRVRDAFSIFLK